MNESRFIILAGKYLSGESTQDETIELEELLKADAEAATRFRTMQQFWNQQQQHPMMNIEEGLKNISFVLGFDEPAVEIVPKKSIVKKLLIYGAAASAILIIGVFFMFRNELLSTKQKPILTEKQNAKGTRSMIELADGSKVWLNVDSKLSYPPEFGVHTREVQLSGEAFFSVTPNKEKPFIIRLNKGTIRVLGTSFNVRAYENEQLVETSVNTGRVAFIPAGSTSDTIFLTPDKKVKYDLKKNLVRTYKTSSSEDKAWIDGRLVFKARTLEDISVELERNFGKKVVFLNDSPKKLVLTGSFQNNTLDEIMYYLTLTKSFTYKITSTELLIAQTSSELENS